MIRRSSAALAALILLGALAGCGGAQENAPKAAERLPDVTLPALGDGEPIDLGTLKGPAVINVWASFCPPCKRELPLYAAFAKKYDGKVQMIGVDFQDVRKENAVAMLRAAGVEYPVVTDMAGEMAAFVLPKLVLVDADGKITYAEYIEIKSAAQLEKIVSDHLGIDG